MAIKLVFDNVYELKELLGQLLKDDDARTGIISIPNVPADDPLNEDDDLGDADYLDAISVKPVTSMFNDEPIITVSPNFEKILHYGRYKYDINKCYFKTDKGKSGRILITGNEALTIIPYLQEGKTDKQIFHLMKDIHNGFYHDKGTMHNTTTVSTIRSFRKRYEDMELNNAIRFYCNNSRVKENPLDYVKFPTLDEDDIECEDLWH